MVTPSELGNFNSGHTKDELSVRLEAFRHYNKPVCVQLEASGLSNKPACMQLEAYDGSNKLACMRLGCNLGQWVVITQGKWSLLKID